MALLIVGGHDLKPSADTHIFEAPHTIASMRALQQQAALAPLESDKKTFLIKDAHLLPLEAANALLKILEEPDAQTEIILTTTDRSAILPTILSRCTTIYQKRTSEEGAYTPILQKALNAKSFTELHKISQELADADPDALLTDLFRLKPTIKNLGQIRDALQRHTKIEHAVVALALPIRSP